MFAAADGPEKAQAGKAEFARRLAAEPALGQAIEAVLAELNRSGDSPERAAALHELIEHQAYRLAHWRIAAMSRSSPVFSR